MDDKKVKSKKEDEIEELEKKISDLEDQLKRTVADYRNLEKRQEEQKAEFVKFANRELLLRLLPVLDTLILANKHLNDQGLTLSIQQFLVVLQKEGVTQIGSTVGLKFDPNLMECVDTVEGEEERVIEEVQSGYKMNDKVLRPALVKVGVGKKVQEEN